MGAFKICLVILPRLPSVAVWRSSLFTLQSSPPSLFRPFVLVCVRVPPRHLTHAGAQLERRCVGVSVGTRFARQPAAGRGSGSSHSQFAAACLAQLPSSVSSRRAAPNNLDWKNKNWKNRLSVCRSSCQRHTTTPRRRRSHFLPFLASSPQIIRTSLSSVSGLGLR